MITEARVKATKYHPEKLPDSWFGNVPNLAEVAPGIVDLKRFAPFVITLTDIGLTPNANVELRARYDMTRVAANTAAMIVSAAATQEVGAWRLPARDILHFTFYGLAGVANFTTHHGLWVVKPTVADKLLYGISLTPEERALNEKLGISNTVEKGLLPLPVSLQIEREYPVMGEETHTASVNIALANTPYTIENLYPRPGEFIVLTRLAAAPGTAAQDIRIVLDRDGDVEIADLKTFPLSTATGGGISCFLPALRELRLSTIATVAPGAHMFRFTIWRVKLNNILRFRFGLASEDEVPKDLADKVKGGVV